MLSKTVKLPASTYEYLKGGVHKKKFYFYPKAAPLSPTFEIPHLPAGVSNDIK